MAYRNLFGRVNHCSSAAHHARLIKPTIGLWGPINHNPLNPNPSSSSTFLHLHESSSATQDSASQNITSACDGTCIYKGAQKDDWIISLAQFAVHQRNEEENKHLRFVRVVGASHTMVSSILYHITLEAVDANKPKIYHAVVWMQLLKHIRELLVWKPVDDCFSALGVKRGDLKLHEAVMFYMNQVKQDHFRI